MKMTFGLETDPGQDDLLNRFLDRVNVERVSQKDDKGVPLTPFPDFQAYTQWVVENALSSWLALQIQQDGQDIMSIYAQATPEERAKIRDSVKVFKTTP